MKTVPEHVTRWRNNHNAALQTFATNGKSGLTLWRACRRLEHLARQITTAACNGEAVRVHSWPVPGKLGWNHEAAEIDFRHDYEKAHDFAASRITDCVRVIFGQVPPGFFVNWDARGMALKVSNPPEGMQQDWGRDGLLAAEIND